MSFLDIIPATVARIVMLVSLACLPLAYCQGSSAGASRERAAQAVVVVAAAQRNESARDVAATERADDETEVTQATKDLTDAVEAIPDSAPSNVRVSLGCARLRAAPRGSVVIPAVCGSESSAQAPATR